MKNVFAAAFSAVFCLAAAARPEVSGVAVSQDPPGSIRISYSLSEGPAFVTARLFADGAEVPAERLATLTGDLGPGIAAGAHSIEWKVKKDMPDLMGRKVAVEAEVVAWSMLNPPDWMVVPLVTNAIAKIRFYETAGEIPGGLGAGGSDLYRTNCIVMRRIRARGVAWTSGSHFLNKFTDGNEWRKQLPCEVKLGSDYWIGVYELTARQYALACNGAASFQQSYVTDRDVRPCDKLYYKYLRITMGTIASPSEADRPDLPPGADSFLGAARRYTGLSFDLPTESEWEFAAKGGMAPNRWNTGAIITNGTADANCPGRYARNGGCYYDDDEGAWKNAPYESGLDAGTAKAGSYAPNAFGLYDMHGNVMEWCRDFGCDEDNLKPVHLNGALNTAFYASPADGTGVHILRGGCFVNTASGVFFTKRSMERYSNSYAGIGCRLVLPLNLTDATTGN